MPTVTFNGEKTAVFTGVAKEAGPIAAAGLLRARAFTARIAVLFVSNLRMAEQWAGGLDFCAGLYRNKGLAEEIQVLPEAPDFGTEDPRVFDLQCGRLAALARLLEFREKPPAGKRLLLITTPKGFFHPAPSPDALAARELRLRAGRKFPFRKLAQKLGGELDYDCEAVCETPGQYAVRGGLVDIYPVNAEAPCRIDFFGDRIESIRTYDPATQRTTGNVSEISVVSFAPAQAARPDNIFDYLGKKATWMFFEPAVLARENPALFESFEAEPDRLPAMPDLFRRRKEKEDRWLGLCEIEAGSGPFGPDCARRECFTEPLANYRRMPLEDQLGADRLHAEQEARRSFLLRLAEWRAQNHAVYLAVRNEGEEERLREILAEEKVENLDPVYLRGNLQAGFRVLFAKNSRWLKWPGTEKCRGAAVAATADIFGRRRTRLAGWRGRRLPIRSQVDQMLDFSELAEGDYLVHMAHGVCLYKGMRKMDWHGRDEETISLEFDEGMMLHLPLTESHLLTRYVGLSKITPKLGRPGGGQWEKTRQAAEKSAQDFAARLLRLQAVRQTARGHAFGPDSAWQKEFEKSFIFEETPDQLQAIRETKTDMERPHPMDRLVCGDVGFGKTEVALRAAFKASMEGKQTAVLVPTTVLAQQHFNTFRERFADYPLSVEMISRFRAPSRQQTILRQLKTGRVDVLVGTHRLLSRDIAFKNLGLLVIDEEHRFGVRHKEKLKLMRETVEVLAMSATPIPRTLYLALAGARDLSVIGNPPPGRLPVQTFVKNHDPELVKRAVQHEIGRGGQVFYLHNRVQSIESVAGRLREMLPGARIAVGHGQMPENRLERIMTDFVAGKYDMLVCTTIIESGLDIPNCNTLIIEGADRFGLSQLYQLRGRVGRFKRQAYAYLLLHRHARLLGQARKRLGAMRQYTQLGAGFRIAMRDLELRGAGNLLGARQSGHIAGVGFDLYCQMLRQSVARMKGEKTAPSIRAQVRIDFIAAGAGGEKARTGGLAPGYRVLKEDELRHSRVSPIDARLPAGYISETELRFDFYRRLAMAASPAEVSGIEAAMRDRFGPCPPAAEALLLVTEIRCLAESRGIASVETEGDRLKCRKTGGRADNYIKTGSRFPRLTASRPLIRLKEIKEFLSRQP